MINGRNFCFYKKIWLWRLWCFLNLNACYKDAKEMKTIFYQKKVLVSPYIYFSSEERCLCCLFGQTVKWTEWDFLRSIPWLKLCIKCFIRYIEVVNKLNISVGDPYWWNKDWATYFLIFVDFRALFIDGGHTVTNRFFIR